MVIVEICYVALTCSDALLPLKAALAQRGQPQEVAGIVLSGVEVSLVLPKMMSAKS